ncbi:orexin receptor type 2-like [Haliotis rufescens]|uniref:orexin receptor type 2-like n=1 Tax=Haliotis rufescens TaxID=6454 RepID=UPI00201FB02F|nr:orexin receptor type 2-like [Haliotis rufescens]
MSNDSVTLPSPDLDLQLHLNNNKYAQQVVPAILFLAILMLVGCIGNSLVFYVYHLKMKRSTTRLYILSLAAFDLLNCVVCIPHEIADMRYNFTFGRYALCKVIRVLIVFSSFGSGSVLLVVAVDRYKKVCRPFQKQITLRTAQVAVTICTVASCLLSLPAFVIYGSRTVPTDIISINGSDCSISDEYINSPFPLLYNGIHFSIFVPSVLCLIVLYSLIKRQVGKQHSYRNKMNCHQNVPSSQNRDGGKEINSNESDEGRTSSSEPELTDVSVVEMQMPNIRPSTNDVLTDPQQGRNPMHIAKGKTRQDKEGSVCSDAELTYAQTSSRGDRGEQRMSFMLFLITLVFVLSFLPHLSLMVALGIKRDLFEVTQGAGLAAINLFIRSYFINSASNPIIYSFFSTNFRRELGDIWRKVHCRV